MKKVAAQVNFCLFLNVYFRLACNMGPENCHMCVNKGQRYLPNSPLTVTHNATHSKEGSISTNAHLVRWNVGANIYLNYEGYVTFQPTLNPAQFLIFRTYA